MDSDQQVVNKELSLSAPRARVLTSLSARFFTEIKCLVILHSQNILIPYHGRENIQSIYSTIHYTHWTLEWSVVWFNALMQFDSSLLFLTLVTGPRRFLSPNLSDTRVYEPQIREFETGYGNLGR